VFIKTLHAQTSQKDQNRIFMTPMLQNLNYHPRTLTSLLDNGSMASLSSVFDGDPHLATLVFDDEFILDEEDQFLAAELVEEAFIRAAARAKRRRIALPSNRQGLWETEVMSGSYGRLIRAIFLHCIKVFLKMTEVALNFVSVICDQVF